MTLVLGDTIRAPVDELGERRLTLEVALLFSIALCIINMRHHRDDNAIAVEKTLHHARAQFNPKQGGYMKRDIIVKYFIAVLTLLVPLALVGCARIETQTLTIAGWNYSTTHSTLDITDAKIVLLNTSRYYNLEGQTDFYHVAELQVDNETTFVSLLQENPYYVFSRQIMDSMTGDNQMTYFFFKDDSFYFAHKIPVYQNKKKGAYFIVGACAATLTLENEGLILFPYLYGDFSSAASDFYVDYDWEFMVQYFSYFPMDTYVIDSLNNEISMPALIISNISHQPMEHTAIISVHFLSDASGNRISVSVS